MIELCLGWLQIYLKPYLNGTIKRFGGKGSDIIDFVYQRNKSDIIEGIFLAYSDDVDNMIEEIIKVK